MGTSNWQQIPFCIETIRSLAPTRVLDVGVGFGRWGMIVREFCEEWNGRPHRENWKIQLEGIEIFPKNIEEYHTFFYNQIHLGDAADLIGQMVVAWDLIILGDVLEHWHKETALQVLDKALTQSKYVLINIPIGNNWAQDDLYDNPYEEHKSSWELIEFVALKPLQYALFKDYKNRDYGTFLFSRITLNTE